MFFIYVTSAYWLWYNNILNNILLLALYSTFCIDFCGRKTSRHSHTKTKSLYCSANLPSKQKSNKKQMNNFISFVPQDVVLSRVVTVI